jgi:hypothetical protein
MSKPLNGQLFKEFKELIMGSKLVLSPKMVDDRSVLNVMHMKGKDTKYHLKYGENMLQINPKVSVSSNEVPGLKFHRNFAHRDPTDAKQAYQVPTGL